MSLDDVRIWRNVHQNSFTAKNARIPSSKYPAVGLAFLATFAPWRFKYLFIDYVIFSRIRSRSSFE